MTLPSAAYLKFPVGSRWVVATEPGKGGEAIVLDHDFGRGLIGFDVFGGRQWWTYEFALEHLEAE